MLTLTIMIPLAGALLLALLPGLREGAARALAAAIAVVPLLLLLAIWWNFDTRPGAAAFQQVAELPWIPSLGVAWRVGVDGIALAVALMSALLFVAAVAWPAQAKGRALSSTPGSCFSKAFRSASSSRSTCCSSTSSST